jgi:hypothetical protein
MIEGQVIQIMIDATTDCERKRAYVMYIYPAGDFCSVGVLRSIYVLHEYLYSVQQLHTFSGVHTPSTYIVIVLVPLGGMSTCLQRKH